MIAVSEQPEKTETIHLYGGMADLLELFTDGAFVNSDMPSEILVEGPAGTGKTFAILCFISELCEKFPGIRVLMARKTLKSLRESVLEIFENEVLPKGHPVKRKSQIDAQQPKYTYPMMRNSENGFEGKSVIICLGFDDVEKLKSTEFDLVFVNEATELTANDWEIACTRCRKHYLPLGNLKIADCNPSAPAHWLNRRPELPLVDADGNPVIVNGVAAPAMRRVLTYFHDNPKYYDHKEKGWTKIGRRYIADLRSSLHGHRFERYFKGNWVAAEGSIWPNFDEHVHVINGTMKQNKKSKVWSIVRKDQHDIPLLWFSAGVDWGWTGPGCITVYGMDKDNVAYMIHEVYRMNLNINEWAEHAERLRKRYDIKRFICDSADPSNISVFNKRMCENDSWRIAYPVNKSKITPLAKHSIVREMLDGGRLFFLRTALESRCKLLEAKKAVCGLIEEIPSYVYRDQKDGSAIKEESDPGCADHAIDSLLYWAWHKEHNDWRPEETKKTFAPLTFGAMFEQDGIMARHCGFKP